MCIEHLSIPAGWLFALVCFVIAACVGVNAAKMKSKALAFLCVVFLLVGLVFAADSQTSGGVLEKIGISQNTETKCLDSGVADPNS